MVFFKFIDQKKYSELEVCEFLKSKGILMAAFVEPEVILRIVVYYWIREPEVQRILDGFREYI